MIRNITILAYPYVFSTLHRHIHYSAAMHLYATNDVYLSDKSDRFILYNPGQQHYLKSNLSKIQLIVRSQITEMTIFYHQQCSCLC